MPVTPTLSKVREQYYACTAPSVLSCPLLSTAFVHFSPSIPSFLPFPSHMSELSSRNMKRPAKPASRGRAGQPGRAQAASSAGYCIVLSLLTICPDFSKAAQKEEIATCTCACFHTLLHDGRLVLLLRRGGGLRPHPVRRVRRRVRLLRGVPRVPPRHGRVRGQGRRRAWRHRHACR